MSNGFVVSARKFRPDSFESLLGQDAVRETLRRAILQQKTAHAYLFCGPRGVGKTSAARIFAKAINCLFPLPDGEACGTCESCKAFEEQRSLNIFELDAASNNSTTDIRRLIEEVSIPPQIGKYRIYIIDEVHMLSTAAFNAFLKTLEEPPSYVVFILATTEKHKILPTILSRCQVYDFRPISVDVIAQQLAHIAEVEGINAEPKALSLIARKADGGMRDALSVFDRIVSFTGGKVTYERTLESLNILDEEYYVRFVNHIIRGEQAAVLLLLDELIEKGFDTRIIVNGLTEFMRTLLIAYDALTLPLLRLPQSQASLYNDLAKRAGKVFLYRSIMQLLSYGKEYRNSNSKRLLAEMTLLSLVPMSNEPMSHVLPPNPGNTPQVPNTSARVKQYTATTIASQSTKPATPSSSSLPNVSREEPSATEPVQSKEPVQQKPLSIPSRAPKLQTVEQVPTSFLKEELSSTAGRQEAITAEPEEESFSENTPLQLTEDTLLAEWFAWANGAYEKEPFLKNTMTLSTPKRDEAGNWVVRVFNTLQLNALEKIMPSLLTHLRTVFSEPSLQIDIKVVDAQQLQGEIETANDWLKSLLQENKHLQRLVAALDLRIAP
ncbi:DNA polymerase III subunit gamma/tau [Porphyromonas circumdentaria]|uniref:DNA polymerase III subunit gamma/tau n=1 Tax=Porphyromonas circumdentaria TaxID=29524 RepID=A0A1T4PSU9_9PORP|nr:DNA polymerase III subunit gamma/tau [Porphyromonas circumdentaria]MBB6276545.1 DNA polymerase-3 subunit gamma/tau [Porphyromonas circumdentaria]SJZ94613.1 DNA polymerase III, tau subunit [Porphyromonas circumdentaria]